MSATFPIPYSIVNDVRREPPSFISKPGQQDNGDISHGADMTKQEEADQREAIHALLLSGTALNKAVAQRLEQPAAAVVVAANGSKWTGWIQTGVICGMLLVSGTNTFKTSESDLRTEVREAKTQASEAKRDAGDAAKEAKKANLNNALLDTYNRELERALIRKGVALPSYPTLEK